MEVQVKSSNGIALIPIDTRLMADRKIFLEGEIDEVKACDFVKKIILLNNEDQKKPIDILINSPGGEINSGMLIYDVIQSSIAPIRITCIGKAYSMAAIIFASVNGKRFMLDHSELMIHEPLLGKSIEGTSSSIKSISDNLNEIKNKMNQILAKHTGRNEEEIEQATSYNHYFNPAESIEFGLCDGVISFNELLEKNEYEI